MVGQCWRRPVGTVPEWVIRGTEIVPRRTSMTSSPYGHGSSISNSRSAASIWNNDGGRIVMGPQLCSSPSEMPAYIDLAVAKSRFRSASSNRCAVRSGQVTHHQPPALTAASTLMLKSDTTSQRGSRIDVLGRVVPIVSLHFLPLQERVCLESHMPPFGLASHRFSMLR
jgi:hypothetical protein